MAKRYVVFCDAGEGRVYVCCDGSGIVSKWGNKSEVVRFFRAIAASICNSLRLAIRKNGISAVLGFEES